VLAGDSPDAWIKQRVLARGESCVPVIGRLAQQGQAAAFAARLDAHDTAAALEAVARAYLLDSVPAREAPAAAPDTRASAAAGQRAGSRLRGEGAPPEAISLLALVPELTRQLQPAQARLLALALIALRAPLWLRNGGYEQAMQSYLDHEWSRARTRDAGATVTIPPRASMRTGSSAADHGTVLVTAAIAQAASATRKRSRGSRQPGVTPPAIAVHAPLAELKRITDSRPHATRSEAPSVASETVGEHDAVVSTSLRNSSTQFGGLFYLLNAALALGLYGDFTAPRARGLALSPWDLLALCGRAWFGVTFVRDPLWGLFAEWAGRAPHEEPGSDFMVPPQTVLDNAWLAPWGRVDTLRYRATRRRLTLWHSHGFVVCDVPRARRQRPRVQALALCEASDSLRGARLQRRIGRATPRARAPLARWFEDLLGYLRARLAVSLGAADTDDIGDLVCRYAAQLELGCNRIDVRLSLAELPLPLRYAGLDRDPGWIPAAGRSVHFHFV
jgi:hypothetical protein